METFKRFRSVWLLATLGLLGAPGVAFGQSAHELAEYQTFIDQALSEYEGHNFAEARALFLKAHAVYPNARTLRGLGMAEFELKNYGASIERLEAALASTAKPLASDLRKQTEELLARARSYVARYRLVLQPSAANARVIVDDVGVDLGAGRPLVLSVGEHLLQVIAEGYAPEKRALNVEGGEDESLLIELRSSVASVATPAVAAGSAKAAPELATKPSAEDAKSSVWRSPWLWTGVVAVVAGGVTTALLLSSHKTAYAPPVQGDIGGVVRASMVR